jgi:hypothetical protein
MEILWIEEIGLPDSEPFASFQIIGNVLDLLETDRLGVDLRNATWRNLVDQSEGS